MSTAEKNVLEFGCCVHCDCPVGERDGHDDTCRLCQCSCGNRYDGDNLCMVSACQWEGIERSAIHAQRVDLADERTDVLARFAGELTKATGDGSRKRQAGIKPPWYEDDAHEAAVFSHITKWKRGELVDPDSGAHPLVHAAWRLLAIACKETGNTPRP